MRRKISLPLKRQGKASSESPFVLGPFRCSFFSASCGTKSRPLPDPPFPSTPQTFFATLIEILSATVNIHYSTAESALTVCDSALFPFSFFSLSLFFRVQLLNIPSESGKLIKAKFAPDIFPFR